MARIAVIDDEAQPTVSTPLLVARLTAKAQLDTTWWALHWQPHHRLHWQRERIWPLAQPILQSRSIQLAERHLQQHVRGQAAYIHRNSADGRASTGPDRQRGCTRQRELPGVMCMGN
eukprot:scaffold18354_cov134-Isochrysis_galbana.AAC.1